MDESLTYVEYEQNITRRVVLLKESFYRKVPDLNLFFTIVLVVETKSFPNKTSVINRSGYCYGYRKLVCDIPPCRISWQIKHRKLFSSFREVEVEISKAIQEMRNPNESNVVSIEDAIPNNGVV